jgi:hypothetical protein
MATAILRKTYHLMLTDQEARCILSAIRSERRRYEGMTNEGTIQYVATLRGIIDTLKDVLEGQ